ncbi:MAG: hypothetical protein FWG65_13385 [Turicibacter sp.]|nr:hypothetical protein [Turicibacter sp.]
MSFAKKLGELPQKDIDTKDAEIAQLKELLQIYRSENNELKEDLFELFRYQTLSRKKHI